MGMRAHEDDREGTTAKPGAPVVRRAASPVSALQRTIGNRAIGQVLARKEAVKDYGSVKIGKLPPIKIVGGNSRDWAAKKDVDVLEVISAVGKHSKQLEKWSTDKTRIDVLTLT